MQVYDARPPGLVIIFTMDLGVLLELDDVAPLRLKQRIDSEDGIGESMPQEAAAGSRRPSAP